MTIKPRNCWEYMKCGREPDGKKAASLGVCPAAADKSFNGINRGKNAGRICWAVAGTLCGGKVQGSFAEKRASCISCKFYKEVQCQEGQNNINTKFLKFIHQESFHSHLKNMAYRYIKAGERFVTQGVVEEMAYIIQKGSCLVIVEKDGELHPVNHYGKGDIVGGLGIFTGEPRLAHVEAETDMEVWVLNREQFDTATKKDPEILDFMTEMVANRFDSKRPTPYRTIGKYVATNIIGRGGYSVVYKGMHEGLAMPVAIKMMRHDMAIDPEFLKTFHNEAKTIASLSHENIIRVYDMEERYRTVFIITELLEGEGLNLLIERLKRIPLSPVINYLTQICTGLDYAHQRGIIHRDINASNIFILPGDRVKILDFGLACPIGTEAVDFSGTHAYMAPEQIMGDAVDPRTDIYSLGILAYEMVTGQRPYPGVNPKELEEMHLTCDIPDPTDIVSDLPEQLRRFIQKACRRNPDARFQDIKHALKAIEPLIASLALTYGRLATGSTHMTSLVLSYDDGQRLALGRELETFRHRVELLGVRLKTADFKDT